MKTCWREREGGKEREKEGGGRVQKRHNIH